jgi:hypothetical protein
MATLAPLRSPIQLKTMTGGRKFEFNTDGLSLYLLMRSAESALPTQSTATIGKMTDVLPV